MVQRFICKTCGKCCSILKFSEVALTSKGPMYGYHGSEVKSGLPLFEWEVQSITEEAQKLGISINIEPQIMYIDVMSQRKIITLWIMLEKSCPFLKENKCVIYNKRPWACEAYPILNTPFVVSAVALNVDTNCPAVTENIFIPPKQMTRLEAIKLVYEVFGNTLNGVIKMETALANYVRIFITLEKTGQVNWMQDYEQDTVVKITEQWPCIGVSKFLKENNVDINLKHEVKKYVNSLIKKSTEV